MAQHASNATIINALGLHARPAMAFVELALTFDAEIAVARADAPDQRVNGKSIMEMMMLAATQGTDLTIHADGSDANDATAALCALVATGFDED